MADLTVPEVSSLSKPRGDALLAARTIVTHTPELREIFLKYKGQTGDEAAKALEDEIVPFLSEVDVEGFTVFELTEVARYLADEYLQIGDSLLVIDRETGRAVAKLSDDDFYQPDLVPRESGSQAQPLVRLRPDVQGRLVLWDFENKREQSLLSTLTDRLVQTPEDRVLGDRRLLATTKGGRKLIKDEIESSLSDLIPTYVSGRLRSFIDLLSTDVPADLTSLVSLSSYTVAMVTHQLKDGKARNLSFDITVSSRSVIASQWTRAIAASISRIAFRFEEPRVHSVLEPSPEGTWIAGPDECLAMQRVRPNGIYVPVVGAHPTLLSGPIGYLVLGNPLIASRELHDRWEMAATLDYTLYLDSSKIRSYTLTDVPDAEATAVLA